MREPINETAKLLDTTTKKAESFESTSIEDFDKLKD